jgi:heptosyltransferase-2
METIIKQDCRFFMGEVPCLPHKQHGVHCNDCRHYEPTTSRILIIKLGAIGDVIRTTPLLRRLKEIYPQAEIWWLTRTPVACQEQVDRKMKFSLESISPSKKLISICFILSTKTARPAPSPTKSGRRPRKVLF